MGHVDPRMVHDTSELFTVCACVGAMAAVASVRVRHLGVVRANRRLSSRGSADRGSRARAGERERERAPAARATERNSRETAAPTRAYAGRRDGDGDGEDEEGKRVIDGRACAWVALGTLASTRHRKHGTAAAMECRSPRRL